jgi:hypothetical protein
VIVDSIDASGWSAGLLLALGIGLLCYVTFLGFLFVRGTGRMRAPWRDSFPTASCSASGCSWTGPFHAGPGLSWHSWWNL